MIRTLALAAVAALAAAFPSSGAPPTLEPVLVSHDWENGSVTAAALRNKVVVLDIFAVACANCRNVTANLRRLYARRGDDVVIVGVHTPELPYERVRSNVTSELRRQGIVWPVAIDNDERIWKALGNEYWPTQYIFDRRGVLRKTIVGDSQDDLVNRTVQALRNER